MKTRNLFLSFASVIAFLSLNTQAFASNQLFCNVSENVNAPLEARSQSFVLNAQLTGPQMYARIGEINVEDLNLKFGVETFSSEVTSPGEQVIIIGLTNNETGAHSTIDGHGSAETFYDVANGSLIVKCAVQ